MDLKQEARRYHRHGRPGKIEVIATKPFTTQRDLSLAYSPGVAVPCEDIAEDPAAAYDYTAKGNLVAVVSNGSAVLGLGNLGALASKPVMEGKGVLFKKFADIDVFDLEVSETDPDRFIAVVQALEPTFGGINLEDIKAPECFYIEETLKKKMNIPVFHDDQHGTAIISGAALLNALELQGKAIDEVRVVVNGAGASAIACARYYLSLGVRPEHMLMCDSKGVIHTGREGLNRYKQEFARDTRARTLAEALEGADVFLGLSVANVMTPEMVKSMNDRPIIFALANPDPEIEYDVAREVREDVIVATGRSDYPNQVNNVLGFPYIFRGALDVRATAINEEMKIAATRALARLAKEDVPAVVLHAYGLEKLTFGPEYIIPKPLDPRVLLWVAPAVAEAAMRTGVAGRRIVVSEYKEQLEAKLGQARDFMRIMINKAKQDPKRIVYPEGENPYILKAASIIAEERIAEPILLGRRDRIERLAKELNLKIDHLTIIDPQTDSHREAYANVLYDMRWRKGIIRADVERMLSNANYFGCLMVHLGHADGMVSGVTRHYPDTIRPALQIVRPRHEGGVIAGVYIMLKRNKVYFFADTTVNIQPSAEQLAEIALMTAEFARQFDIEPRVAMLSFSNFGSARTPESQKVAEATALIRQKAPDLVVDGEVHADTALIRNVLRENFPLSTLAKYGGANVLIFPDLDAGNIAYKLVNTMADEVEAIGPLLIGLRKPVHVLQFGTNDERDIMHVTAIAVVDAQHRDRA
ncbi:MAG: NADP-dependent malic enzyme [candidate division KSB1 bacterium]|nr:NADP-dependent malic enzyme [candidate division KSB1 bacterium]